MFLLCAALAFTACAESRYRSNLQNAPVTRWTHLSRADYEQVVRLVSDSTQQPIVGITTDGVKRDPPICMSLLDSIIPTCNAGMAFTSRSAPTVGTSRHDMRFPGFSRRWYYLIHIERESPKT